MAAASLAEYGGVVVLNSLLECCEFCNRMGPEHLELVLDNPQEALEMIENAGGIFLGGYTPEPLGDYLAGTNHVLPTCGTSRFSSPLGVYDFVKRSSVLCYNKERLPGGKGRYPCICASGRAPGPRPGGSRSV